MVGFEKIQEVFAVYQPEEVLILLGKSLVF